MLRKITSFCLAGLLLVGCSGKKTEESQQETTPIPTETVTVSGTVKRVGLHSLSITAADGKDMEFIIHESTDLSASKQIIPCCPVEVTYYVTSSRKNFATKIDTDEAYTEAVGIWLNTDQTNAGDGFSIMECGKISPLGETIPPYTSWRVGAEEHTIVLTTAEGDITAVIAKADGQTVLTLSDGHKFNKL